MEGKIADGKRGNHIVSTLIGSGDLKKMTERWIKDGSWLKELP
jgi:hypothetical protein